MDNNDLLEHLSHECLNDEEREAVRQCLSLMPFYKLSTTNRGERKKKIDQFNRHLEALKSLIQGGVTLEEYDTLSEQLEAIKTPSFIHASGAESRRQYIAACKERLHMVGKVRQKTIISGLLAEFDRR